MWCPPKAVHCIYDDRILLEQILQHGCVAITSGQMQGRSEVVIAERDVNAVDCKKANAFNVSLGSILTHFYHIG